MTGLILYVALFLIGTETFLVSPLLPSIALDLGRSPNDAAAIVNAYALSYAVLAPVLAIVTDGTQRRIGIIVGMFLFLVGNLVSSLSSGLDWLIVARGVGGLGAALAGPAIWALLADLASAAGRGRAIGLGMAAFSLGQVAGVPIGSFVAAQFGWRSPFGAIAGLSLLLVLAAGAVLPALKGAPDRSGSPPARRLFGVWLQRETAVALVITFFFHAANLGAYTFLGVDLTRRFDLSAQQLGLVGVLVGTGSVVGALIGRKVPLPNAWGASDPASRLPVWSVLLGLSIVGASVSGTIGAVALCVFLWFAASGAFVSDQQTLLATLAPMRRASASSWNTTTMHIGTACSVWAIGFDKEASPDVLPVVPILAGAAFLVALRLIVLLRRPVPLDDGLSPGFSSKN
ncbi:MFS transporter [Telmatospirillum siberiense]|nr:MFS transporter [Telmatospirillum siberiense]